MGSKLAIRAWSLRSPKVIRDLLILLLAFTAGCVDAISYLGLGHVFTANMTGNTVLLGLSLAQAQWLAASRSAVALAGYLLGVAGGGLLMSRDVWQRKARRLWPKSVTVVCALELVVLVGLTLVGVLVPATATGDVDVLIFLAAVAMGLQGMAAHGLGIRGVATTYITGTWTRMMAGLVSTVRAEHAGSKPTPGTKIRAAVVGVYLLAAVVGGVTDARWHRLALVIPTVVIAGVVASAWRRFHGQKAASTRARGG